ncbi:NAD(P)H-binding protein [Salimicrobium sp. PL1-032A]|uniref:NAD(P)-dependent oxidoreductase n=1 Tax=Salimicrobium sp. PL1-032A TaxID=3095364 RepID=UPI00326021A4
MKFVVFGGTGSTGLRLVNELLERGHEVYAYARSPEKLYPMEHERLAVIEGSLDEREKIKETVRDVDAVISLLGPSGRVRKQSLSEGVINVVETMGEVGTKRFAGLATSSVKDPKDEKDFRRNAVASALQLGFANNQREVQRLAAAIRSTDLDWTLVRVGYLTDRGEKPVKVGYYGRDEVGMRVSRSSVAKFMADLAESEEYVKESPVISN